MSAFTEEILQRTDQNFPHLKRADVKLLVERIIADTHEDEWGDSPEDAFAGQRGGFASNPSVVTWGGGLSPLAASQARGRPGACAPGGGEGETGSSREAVLEPTEPLFSPRGRQFSDEPKFLVGGKQFTSQRQFSPVRVSPMSSPRRPAAGDGGRGRGDSSDGGAGVLDLEQMQVRADAVAAGASAAWDAFHSKPSVVSWTGSSPLASPVGRASVRGSAHEGHSNGALQDEGARVQGDFTSRPSVVSWMASPLASPVGRTRGDRGRGGDVLDNSAGVLDLEQMQVRADAVAAAVVATPDLFTADGRGVCILPDFAAVLTAVSKEVEAAADAAIQSKGCFSLMLPSGMVIEALAGLQLASPDKVFVFFTHGSAAVPNYQQAMDHFGTRLGVPAANIFDASTSSASEYETLLTSHKAVDQGPAGPVLDMIALGIGADGHCGALHPNSPATLATGKGDVVVALSDDDTAGPGVAVSMDVMRRARRVLVACAGAPKADVVHAALAGAEDAACPVSLLRTAATAWFVDVSAADKFQKAEYQHTDSA